MDANDKSGQGLQLVQSVLKFKILGQTNFSGKLWASEDLNMNPINNNRKFRYEIFHYSVEISETGFVTLIKFWFGNDQTVCIVHLLSNR